MFSNTYILKSIFLTWQILQTHLGFGREFTEAVEMKQVAQQEAEKAKYLVEKAEQMKIAAITTAEGDAQAAKLLSLVRLFILFYYLLQYCSVVH